MPSLLAVIPHPDDESYAFAATIAAAAASGWQCHVECASAGEEGKRHDGGPAGPSSLGNARVEELAASCELLGALPPRVWGLPDGHLREAPAQVARVAALFRSVSPQVVLSLGPDGAYGHPDHLAVWRWVTAAWEITGREAALLFAAFPPGLFAPQWEKCRSMMGEPPDPPVTALGRLDAHYELRSQTLRRLKLASIRCHRSQLPGDDPEALFPPGLVNALLPAERYSDALGRPQARVREWFAAWQRVAGPGEEATCD